MAHRPKQPMIFSLKWYRISRRKQHRMSWWGRSQAWNTTRKFKKRSPVMWEIMEATR